MLITLGFMGTMYRRTFPTLDSPKVIEAVAVNAASTGYHLELVHSKL